MEIFILKKEKDYIKKWIFFSGPGSKLQTYLRKKKLKKMRIDAACYKLMIVN